MQPLDWPHDTNLMRYENNSVVTEEIVVHALRSFASQFAQGIIYFMNSLGTADANLQQTTYQSQSFIDWLLGFLRRFQQLFIYITVFPG